MRRLTTFTLFVLLFLSTSVRADEGLWLPSLIEQGRIRDMRAKGLKIKAQDLYSPEQASLKDAIVRFGSGCTGELISDEGLLITNHHCGYSQIQQHSTTEKDYLTNGFAAMKRSEELVNPGLVVSFLVDMKDVTDLVNSGVDLQQSDSTQARKIKQNISQIVKSATEGTHYKASVEALFYGNQYFLFTYEVFEDVRLVFAPPSAIGKFGGDTDNWMWPRHTGDFSIFRVYASKDNKPAKYSADNVPYTPKKSFTISLKGMKDGDFTFVYGFPGRTTQYLHSEAIRYIQERGDPHKIALRTTRLNIMNEAMAKSAATRIQYASKNASVSNAWKKWQGEVKGVQRLGTVAKKRALEANFEQWAADKPEFKGVTFSIAVLYDSIEQYAFANDYYSEAVFAVELMKFADQINTATKKGVGASGIARLKEDAAKFYKDYNVQIDRDIAIEMLAALNQNISDEFLPSSYNKSKYREFIDSMFSQSLLSDSEKWGRVLDMDSAAILGVVESDPATVAAMDFVKLRNDLITKEFTQLNERINELYKTYMRGLMVMQRDREFYPDANSTLRIAYGKIDGYQPIDAVSYMPNTTLEGVMQKDNPEIYDYDIPSKLREVYTAKDYGKWEVEGTVPVAFIATNHTTGGNSGSPVLNARGELIGVNFDRCWEGTMSDLEYDPAVCRNIAIDIRYALFLIDKVGGAGYLLDEMKFAK